MASAELGCLKKVPTIESFDDDAEPTSRDSCVFIFCGGWGGAVGGGNGLCPTTGTKLEVLCYELTPKESPKYGKTMSNCFP